jgi:predicted metal-dependent peptidase
MSAGLRYNSNTVHHGVAAMTTTTQNRKLKSRVGIKTDANIDRMVREKLITARIALLLKAPFFGNMATRLDLINADEWCSTAATDGRRFYYNSEFIHRMPARQVEFLFGHEVLHVVYDHLGRRGERDAALWNVASDYCVNNDLLEQKIGERIPVGLYDTKYSGWSAEQVYDDLYENAEKIDIEKMLDQLVDEHLEDQESSDDSESQSSESGAGRQQMSQEERKALRDEIKEAVLAAASTVKNATDLPAGVRRMINELTAPQLSWRDLLPQQIQSTIKNDYTWQRPSRRSWHMDAVLPGTQFDKEIDVCVAIDASGSMSNDMLRDILSEVKGIMDSYTNFRLHVWSFDTKVYNATVFTQENLDDILDWHVAGGGGTDFPCNWDFMKHNDIEPKYFVMFTDGYPCGSWGDDIYCDTMFVIHGSTTIQAPFGITTYYDLDKVRKTQWQT